MCMCVPTQGVLSRENLSADGCVSFLKPLKNPNGKQSSLFEQSKSEKYCKYGIFHHLVRASIWI